FPRQDRWRGGGGLFRGGRGARLALRFADPAAHNSLAGRKGRELFVPPEHPRDFHPLLESVKVLRFAFQERIGGPRGLGVALIADEIPRGAQKEQDSPLEV